MTDNVLIIGTGNGFVTQKTGSTIVPFATKLNFTQSSDATVTVTDSGGGVAAINVNSPTATQNLFETIAVSGQSNVVADSSTDTLTLVAGTNISITTNAATDTITITNSTIFGTQFQQVVDSSISTTSSTVYVNKMTFNTTSLPSGTYRITWYVEGNSTNGATSNDIRCTLNGTTIGNTIQEPKDATEITNFKGFYYTTLSGINTINIDFRIIGTTANVSIRNARIEVWRTV